MTGGPITTTGTVSVLANTGIVANATGVFVNATYIGTISANNASFLGTVAAASYVQNTDSRTLSGNLVISGTSFTPSSNTILLGNSTQRWVLSANTGSFSGAVSGITTLAAGNTTITGFANVTSTIQGGSSLAIAGALSGVTTAAMGNTTITGYANVTTSVNSALLTVGVNFIANTTGAYHTGTVNAASHTVGTAFTANSTVVNAVSYYAGSLLVANSTVSNATHLGGQLPAFYTNATNITTGTLPYAQIPANIINTTAAFTRTGITTFSANVVLGSSGLSSNGGFGTAGQVLTSNGSSTYWSTASGGSGSVMNRQVFTGNGSTTTFTITNGYTANQIDVYVNGVKMYNGVDVTVTSGTSIVFAVAPPNGSIIDTVSFTLNTMTAETGAYYKGGAATVGLPSNANNIFRINGSTLHFNTTIANEENAQCAGPIAVASGITLTVDTGGRVVII
jgi:hypothetical protein